jgi:hypothetical protein
MERELLREVAEKTGLIERLKASEAKLTQLAEEHGNELAPSS